MVFYRNKRQTTRLLEVQHRNLAEFEEERDTCRYLLRRDRIQDILALLLLEMDYQIQLEASDKLQLGRVPARLETKFSLNLGSTKVDIIFVDCGVQSRTSFEFYFEDGSSLMIEHDNEGSGLDLCERWIDAFNASTSLQNRIINP